MMILAIVALALVLVYALKAVAIVKGHEDLTSYDTSFSWARIRPQDVQTAQEWTQERPAVERQPRVALGSSPFVRHVGA